MPKNKTFSRKLSAVRIPGFSAMSSIYTSPSTYRSSRKSDTTVGDLQVVYPASPITRTVCGKCICDTYDFGQPGVCAKICIDTINGRPTSEAYPIECDSNECNPPCDQKTCGPCTQECTYPNGYTVTQGC